MPQNLRVWATRAGVTLFAALDLYAMHAVAIPYYTGMIRHRPDGSLAALHGADFAAVGLAGAFERLAAFKTPSGFVMALWLAHLLATATIVVLAFSGKLYGRPVKQRC
jgi:hypothetical protein